MRRKEWLDREVRMGYRWSFYARAQEREDWPELPGSDVHGVFFLDKKCFVAKGERFCSESGAGSEP